MLDGNSFKNMRKIKPDYSKKIMELDYQIFLEKDDLLHNYAFDSFQEGNLPS